MGKLREEHTMKGCSKSFTTMASLAGRKSQNKFIVRSRLVFYFLRVPSCNHVAGYAHSIHPKTATKTKTLNDNNTSEIAVL